MSEKIIHLNEEAFIYPTVYPRGVPSDLDV